MIATSYCTQANLLQFQDIIDVEIETQTSLVPSGKLT